MIPGISSVQVLAAKHRIALNRIGESVLLTTGRKLAEGFPDDAGSVVVLLDGVQAFASLADPDLEIFWGAYLGTDHEILRSGKLAEVKDEIASVRQTGARSNTAGSWTFICFAGSRRRHDRTTGSANSATVFGDGPMKEEHDAIQR